MTTATTYQDVGFLGLGALGSPIAANLLASSVKLAVWNRTPGKADALVAQGATLAREPAQAITRGGIVFTILWDDASLEDIAGHPAFLGALGPGGVHVSMTTVTPATARRMAELHARHGSAYVEAPIFGVPTQAVARQLIVCLAGPAAAKARVRPLLEAMGGERVVDFGEQIGAGTATKLVGNFMIISGFVAMREAFDVLQKSGVDPKPTFDLLTTTLFATPSHKRYAEALVRGVRPTSAIPRKDIGLFERFAEAVGADASLAEEVRTILERE
jgi:3-hydroxyisobutyrate dehydrogenase-like beta-hydroxyacid dehydrogenase